MTFTSLLILEIIPNVIIFVLMIVNHDEIIVFSLIIVDYLFQSLKLMLNILSINDFKILNIYVDVLNIHPDVLFYVANFVYLKYFVLFCIKMIKQKYFCIFFFCRFL